MKSLPLLIVGAGGHAKVVIDTLQSRDPVSVVIVVDDDPAKQGVRILGYEVVAPVRAESLGTDGVHIAIGDNAARERLAKTMEEMGHTPVSVIHMQASVAPSARIGEGSFVAAKAVVGPDADIGEGCVINHGAVVDHDGRVGAYSHIAPNATLGGGVVIGRRVLIGAGANILPGITIGDDCVIGAGAVVLQDVPPEETYVGLPAERLKKGKSHD